MTISLKDLEDAWDAAEVGDPEEGDLIIQDRRGQEGGFDILPAAKTMKLNSSYRILERAPKPEPRPRAVLARALVRDWPGDDEHPSDLEVFVETPYETWESLTYDVLADDLVDPVEMVPMPEEADLYELAKRLYQEGGGWPGAGRVVSAVLDLLEGEAK